MNDEFLHSLRRQPPARFARELQRKLQAQEKRRVWSRRIRTLLLLVAGPALATGIYVFQRVPAESVQTAPPPAPIIAEAPPVVAPSDARVAAQPAPSEPVQTTNSAPAQSRPAVKIAASPLTHELIRNVLNSSRLRLSEAAPRVEQMDSAAALIAFCAPELARRFDIVVTSRRMTREEFIACRDRGVHGFVEAKIGYQALVLTSARDSVPIRLSAADLYLAVGRRIIDPAEPGRWIDNPNITWDQVNSKLPYRPIAVFGPTRATSLRALFESLLLDPACKTRNIQAELCHSLRADRLYTEVEQTASLIPQYLWAEPDALVLIDYDFYRENRAQLASSALEGPEPSYATFADGTYPLARPIYLYTDLGRIGRAAEGHVILQSLMSLQLSGANSFGLVRLDERDARERSRWNTLKSESDLITNKE
jgi:phosphate transport system substrate-binding protein